MQQVPHQVEPTGTESALYIALELGARRWLLAFGVGVAAPGRRRELPAGDREVLRQEIADAKRRFGLPASAPVRSCYEAGRDGFWIHRMLATEGIANTVVDSASIEVSRRGRRAKTDRLDADRLLRMLIRHWSGERALWKVVHVPSPDAEDARHAERAITALVEERTRQRSRLKALLALHVVQDPIRATFGGRLAHLTDWAGQPLPVGARARRIGIVALARKLLIALWRIASTGSCRPARSRADRGSGRRTTDGSASWSLAFGHGKGWPPATRAEDRTQCPPCVRSDPKHFALRTPHPALRTPHCAPRTTALFPSTPAARV